MTDTHYDAIILGAGAAGLMAAWTAAARGRQVGIIEQGQRAGGKIWIAGGGKCNFTNLDCQAKHFISQNPHFVKSALARFTPWDMISLLAEHQIEWEEREHGRLFCRHSAGQIVNMLLDLCRRHGVTLHYSCPVQTVEKTDTGFAINTSNGVFTTEKLIVALGGAAWPQCGATTTGYAIARQFGLEIIPPRPGLTPLLYDRTDLSFMETLSGNSITGRVACGKHAFTEEILFTHRGLSGPAILQISNYWQPGQTITIDWAPGIKTTDLLTQTKLTAGARTLAAVLQPHFPARFIRIWQERYLPGTPLAQWTTQDISFADECFNRWAFQTAGPEGFNKAETTLGGVSVAALSSKTLGVNEIAGLYFIGEVVDVAGQLGGYNLHWAWASGHSAGLAL